MFYVKEIRGLIFTMFIHKKLEIVSVFVQRSGRGELAYGFSWFYRTDMERKQYVLH